MKVLEFAVHAPLVGSKVKMGIRFISLVTAAGIPLDNITTYDEGSIVNINYLMKDYIPVMYPIHSPESEGFLTIHPIDNNVVDTFNDINYLTIMTKMIRKATIIYNKLGPSVMNPDFLYDHDVRFFVENSKGQFGEQLLKSMTIIEDFIVSVIDRHLLMFYLVTSGVIIFIIFIITQVIIPYSNKSYNFIKSIILLFKTLPSTYFNEQSSEYADQIVEICENYEVEDEKFGKNKP